MAHKDDKDPKDATEKKPVLRHYIFPDIDGDSDQVTIDAASLEEATKLYHQQKGKE